jgi:hypothetical protein
MALQSEYYNVFKVKNHLALQDPEEAETRYHTVIFVETKADGSGYFHHVTGDITSGMTYQRREENRPEDSQTFFKKEFIGLTPRVSYPAGIDRVCKSQPPPHRQKKFNTSTMKYQACKPDGSFYGPHEARPRYFKCTEWTELKAIPALYQANLILQGYAQQPRPQQQQQTWQTPADII